MRVAIAATAVCLSVIGLSVAADVDAAVEPDSRENRDKSKGGLETIVVTARKRSAESIQTVPLSMTAFSAAQLESKGVVSFADYANAVPNLSYGYDSGDGALASRGVALRGVVGARTTGLYIDDTPVIETLDPRVIGIERIEVLRGPQGTLYGAASMGGTIRLITKQPHVHDFSGDAHISLSSTSHSSANDMVDGDINAPLIADRLALRVSAYQQYEAGWFDWASGPLSAPPTSIRRNVNTSSYYGGQIALRWEPLSRLSVTPRVMYQQIRLAGFPYADINPDNFVVRRPVDIREGGTDKWTLSSLTINYATSFGAFTSSTSYFQRNTLEHEDSSEFWSGFFNLPNPLPGVSNRAIDLDRFAQEIRFASTFNGPFQFVAGSFYADSRVPRHYDHLVTGLSTAGVGLMTDVPDVYHDLRPAKEFALFGEASYDVLDNLTATLGLRYYNNKTSFEQDTISVFSGFKQVAKLTPTSTESGVAPKYLIQYSPSNDIMIYSSASKGFRIGGNNIFLPPTCDADLAAINLTRDGVAAYKSDSLWDYDVGVKSTLADRRVTLNVAGFDIDWSNIQQSIRLAKCGFGFTGNAGKARSRGVEVEFNAQPRPNLTLGLNAGYTDAKITQAAPNSPQLVGSAVYQVPNWTGSANFGYWTQLFANVRGFVRGDYNYAGFSYSANNDVTNPRLRPAYRIINARFGVQMKGYEVALFGNNLGNERANLADSESIAAEVPGRPRIVVNQPRTVGIEARAQF